MPIDFLCGQCQHTLRVPEESAGKKARCPQCGHVQAIPEADPPPGGGFDVGQFERPASSGMGGPTQLSGPGAPGGSGAGYSSSGPYQPQQPQQPETPYQSYPGESPQHRPNPYQSPAGPGYYAPQPKTRGQVEARVKPPAIALMIVAALSGLMALFMVFVGAMAVADQGGNPDEGDFFAFAFFIGIFVVQVVIGIGAARMMVLKNYGFAITAAILSLLSGLCCQLLMPFGIWALVILCDSDTRAQFR